MNSLNEIFFNKLLEKITLDHEVSSIRNRMLPYFKRKNLMNEAIEYLNEHIYRGELHQRIEGSIANPLEVRLG